jgi:competence protein ComEC
MPQMSHRRNFGEYPLAALAVSLAAGVLLSSFTNAGLTLSLTLAALASFSAFVSAFKSRRLASSFVVAAFLFAGASLASIESRAAGGGSRLRLLYERGLMDAGEPTEVTGVVEREPESTPDGLLFDLRVESVRARGVERACAGRVEFFARAGSGRDAARYAALELRRGARVRIAAVLDRAERYRNPGVNSSDEYLARLDLDARATIKSPLLVERLDDERVFLPAALLDQWRARLVRAADETFNVETAGVFKAALLGNRLGLTRTTAERFRDGGTFHVLVISGLHITFLGGLAWAFARRLTRRRALQWAASAAFVWAYAALVGGEASVVRAALTFTLAALAPVLGRRSNPVNGLGGAALALLVARPSNLFDPSFQLTFLSVAAIVALALPLLSSLRAVGEWRPTRATPYPPACPLWFQTLGEALYWRERIWLREMSRAANDYRLFKTHWAARLERWRVQALLRYTFAAVLVSVVVQTVLLPLLVIYFHRLSLASPLLNIFVGALMVLLAAFGLAAIALAHWSQALAAPLVRVTETAAALMSHSVDPFARAHLASVRLPEYAGWPSLVYALYFVPLLVLASALLRWRPLASPPRANEHDGGASRNDSAHDDAYFDTDAEARLDATSYSVNFMRDSSAPPSAFTPPSAFASVTLKLAAAALALMLFLVVAHPFSEGLPDGRLRVDFLDVGQGDSALVTTPDGATILVDGGGRPALGRDDEEDSEEFEPDARGVGEAVVCEYLWRRGLSRIDFVIATHADADHTEGLGAVLRSFKVGALLVARAPSDDPEFLRLATEAREANVPVYIIGRGDRLRFGAAALEVLWPALAEADADAPSANNDSLVLRLRLGRRTLLLTGDAEAQAEAALVRARDELLCDVLKAGHHGSRTSSTQAFVEATRPALVVVSVGRASPYGHPHAEVLARWRAAGSQVLTTGERGTITVSTDGEDLKAETFVRQ